MNSNGSGFDLSQLSFDEFVSFFFDHNIDAEEFWYHDPDMLEVEVSSPRVVVEHMMHLFTTFSVVASNFSLRQINAGIWAMFGPHPFVFQKHLWLPAVPLSDRIGCIRSMYFVYSDYVSKSAVRVMENCFSMWWDFIAGGFWQNVDSAGSIEPGEIVKLNRDQRAILDSIFDTLSEILMLPDERTQGYALHGLGHLHHPQVSKLVQNFLDSNRSRMSPDEISWIEKCRDGKVM